MTTAAAGPTRARTDWPALIDAASAPYRNAGRFAWRFARGKLGMDPVFRHVLKHGLIAPRARVLDIGRGQGLLASLLRSCAALGNAAEFICGGMRRTPFPEVDAVVILDVLHYLSVPEQNEVLARVRRALRDGGRLLLRSGDGSAKRRFIVSALREWIVQLESLGFVVQSQPMSRGTPFANVLLVASVGKLS